MRFFQQVEFELHTLTGLLILIPLLPLRDALSQKFLTAQLLRALGLFNLHLIVVPFLGSLIVGRLHLFKIFHPYLKEFLLQCLLLAVEGVPRTVEVHLRLCLLGLLLPFGLLDFHGGVLFEPFGLIVGFLLQKSLIVLVLGKIEPLVDVLAVGKVFQFNLMLAEKKVSP